MGATFDGDWARAEKYLKAMEKKLNRVILIVLKKEAEALRGIILKGFVSQSPGGKPFQPLSVWTIAMRRFQGFSGNKALIHTGEMRKSIISKVYPATLSAFVGILYSSINKDGESLVNIGKVHEFGSRPFVVDMTPKMRRFLAMVAKQTGLIHYNASSKGRSRYLIKIPARPFLQPSLEPWKVGLAGRVNAQISQLMR